MIAYLVIRFVMRLINPPRSNQAQKSQNNSQSPKPQGAESLEKPKFTIEAESVDYEIIEEPNRKNEE